MVLTKNYLKFIQTGVCNLVGSVNGAIRYVDRLTCAVIAAESITFYNMRTLEKTYEIRCEGKIVTAFMLSPDKSIIAIGYNDGAVHLHKRQQDDVKIVFAGHKTGVNCIAFSHDGLILATGGKDSVIVIWDIVNESGICRLNGHKGSITHLKFSQDDQYLISCSKDTQIKFWSMLNKACFYTLAESSSEVYSFALVNSDRLLIVANAEIELLIFEIRWNGKQYLKDFEDEEDEIDSKRLKNVDINESDGLQEQANEIIRCRKRGSLMRQSKGRALQIAVSNDESVICCVGSDTLMDIYRHFNEEESQKRFHKKLRKMRQRINMDVSEIDLEAEVRKDITTLITRIGDFRAESKIKWVDMCESYNLIADGNIREYRFYCLLKTNDVQGISLRIEWKSNKTEALPLASLGQRVHKTDVRALAISSDASFFVSGSQESAIIWDMASLSPLNKLLNADLSQISASMIVHDKYLILGTRTGAILLFNLQSCELMEKQLEAHQDVIVDIYQIPVNDGFFSCSQDKTCRFWNYIKSGDDNLDKGLTIRSRRMLELPDEPLCAAVSPNGNFIAFGLLDNTARVYYMDTLKFFVSLYGHSMPIYSIDISHDSKLLITGSGDKSIKIWGLDFGDCHKSLFAHDDTVTCVKFGRDEEDEKLFWSSGKDGKLKQWDAVKFNHIQTLEGHTDEISDIKISSNGRCLISASRDKSIRIWELSDEIIVLQEEEENKREKEYEQKILDDDDIVPGEQQDPDTDMAPLKTYETIKSTETIIDAIELIRQEKAAIQDDPTYVKSILLRGYPDNSEHLYLLDTMQKIRQSHLERSLLALPFSYITELLFEMSRCIRNSYKLEIASRVVTFIMRIHHNQIIDSLELLPLIDELKNLMPSKINSSMSLTGFNIAALKFLQMSLEERQNSKIFNPKVFIEEKEKKKRKRQKVKNTAIYKPI